MKYAKMDPKVKVKWLKALRSRKFKQGKGYLKNTDLNGKIRHCCLGVLSEICNIENSKNDDSYYEFDFKNKSKECDAVPDNFKGLSGDVIAVLIDMNDNGKKFYQIARWIERNL